MTKSEWKKKIDVLNNRFGSHLPDENGKSKMITLRRACFELAEMIELLCPDGREKETALTQLSFVMMSANSAIAQQYPLFDEKKCS